MHADYSLDALMEFADFLADKGLLNKNTASARKSACAKVFGVLSPEEKVDLREIDVDEVTIRFNNLQGNRYNPQSLRVYKSRANASLTDFVRYKRNPAAFKIEITPKKAKTGARNSNSEGRSARENDARGSPEPQKQTLLRRETVDIPVPLGSECIVYVNGLPVDLTEAEALKIAAVVQAMVSVSDG